MDAWPEGSATRSPAARMNDMAKTTKKTTKVTKKRTKKAGRKERESPDPGEQPENDDTLEIYENWRTETWYIAWTDAEYGEGLCLGEKGHGDEEHVLATKMASTIGNPTQGANGRLEWPTAKMAERASIVAKAAVAQHRSGKPWPEWALQAKAAGWKPPKGWKPS